MPKTRVKAAIGDGNTEPRDCLHARQFKIFACVFRRPEFQAVGSDQNCSGSFSTPRSSGLGSKTTQLHNETKKGQSKCCTLTCLTSSDYPLCSWTYESCFNPSRRRHSSNGNHLWLPFQKNRMCLFSVTHFRHITAEIITLRKKTWIRARTIYW